MIHLVPGDPASVALGPRATAEMREEFRVRMGLDRRVVRIRRGALYLADLNLRLDTESGKLRPVLVIQTDLLNEAGDPSTWVLPCTPRKSSTAPGCPRPSDALR